MDYKKINSILMRVVAVLLMLVMLSTGMVSGRYARYVTTATYEDGARVARFNVVMTEYPLVTNVETKIKPGESTMDAILVKNYSEVAVALTFRAETVHGEIPLMLTLVDGETVLATNNPAENTPLIYKVDVPAGQEISNMKIRVSWPADGNNLQFVGKANLVRITAIATQID